MTPDIAAAHPTHIWILILKLINPRVSPPIDRRQLEMIFDEFFGRVVVISLANAAGEVRASRAIKELSDKGLSGKAQVVRAVDGRLCQPPAWWLAGPGAWGCMKSHVRAIEDALMDGLESLVLIEDDCIWQKGASGMAKEFLEQLPTDWGQAYFGGQHRSDRKPAWVDGRPAVLRAHRIHRTHAYAIRRPAMVKLLQHIQHAPDYIAAGENGVRMHVDHQMEVAHERGDWTVYCPSWWLAGQGENMSTLTNRYEPARWWHIIRGESYRSLPLIVADRLPSEEEARWLHFGNHISKDDVRKDEGIANSENSSHCHRIMEIITKEAVRLQRMPAIIAGEQADWMRKVWLGPVIDLGSGKADLEALCDYPEAKLLSHRWFNPSRPVCTNNAQDEPAHDGPKVHQVWIGTDEMPERLARYCAGIERSFRDWEYKLWREEDMEELAQEAILPDVVRGTEQVGMGVRADVVRLEIIRQHGGIYLDCDFEALRPDLRPLFERKNCFYYADERPAFPMNSLLGSHERGNAFVDLYLQRIAGNLRRSAGEELDTHMVSGPHQFNATLNVWADGEWRDAGPVKVEGQPIAALFAERSLVAFYHWVACPYAYGKGNFATFDPSQHPKAWLVHHWAETWHHK